MSSVFDKHYDDMDDAEKKLWEVAYGILMHGDRLYGIDIEDTSHISWAIGLALKIMPTSYPASVIFEISIDEKGYAIRFILPDQVDADDDTKQQGQNTPQDRIL